MSETQVAAAREDSISSQDPNNPDNKEKKAKSRRPANTAFRQQRLKAWQPILTPKTVLPLFFAIGIIFGPIGGLLLYASAQVQELVIDYSDCVNAPNGSENAVTLNSNQYSSSFKSSSNSSAGNPPSWYQEPIDHIYSGNYGSATVPSQQCVLQFHIPTDLTPPVLFYYQLSNFYQNHRRYVKSLSTDQLLGDFQDNDTIKSSACDPLTKDDNGFAYYPCGLIANSIFNDTFTNPELLNAPGSDVPITYEMENNTNIAWDSDKALYGKTKYTHDQVVPPPFWQARYNNGKYNSDDELPNLREMENFQVWMRTAGLPVFAKLYQRGNKTMGSGDYRVNITMNFPVKEYGGQKKILISTSTVAGGKNPFLGIAYIVVAGICVVLGAIFTVTHLVKPRKLGDHTYLTWNNEPPPTATASGREVRPGNA